MSAGTLASIAKATVIGEVSGAAEVRHTSTGKPITNFRVRIEETFRGRDGGQQTRSSELPVSWWGDHELPLGALVYIEARLTGRSFESRGETKYASEVTAEKIVVLAGDHAERPPSRSSSTRSAPPDSAPPDDSDIPF